MVVGSTYFAVLGTWTAIEEVARGVVATGVTSTTGRRRGEGDCLVVNGGGRRRRDSRKRELW